ncbi:MAG: cysteine-rich CWC family protein [Acidobacteriota bacterium]
MILRQLLSFIFSGWQKPRVCEACQRPFHCTVALTGCWCSKVKLTEKTRQQLRSKYSHCLCRDCLEGAATENVER